MKYTRPFVLFALVLGLSGCSMFGRKASPPAPSSETTAATPSPVAPSTTASPPSDPNTPAAAPTEPAIAGASDLQVVLKTADGKIVTAPGSLHTVASPDLKAQKQAAHAVAEASGGGSTVIQSESSHAGHEHTKNEAHAHGRTVGPVPADKAFGWMKNGNRRFSKGFLRKDGQSQKDVARLAQGQAPHSIVLSCSDSRVPPEIVFDQKLGEIFVVRTAGPNLDPAVIASIEYAVEHLGSNLILVMGHSGCGAVKAAMSTLEAKQDLGSPWLNKLVAAMHPRLAAFSRKPASEGFVDEAWANVDGVAADLLRRSDIVRAAADSGTLKVREAVYHLQHGVVDFKD